MAFSYRIVSNDLAGELAVLSAEEVVDHLRNYLGNFLLDATVGLVYLNRFLSSPESTRSDFVHSWVQYLVKRLAELQPLNYQLVQMACKFGYHQPHKDYLVRCDLSSMRPLEFEAAVRNRDPYESRRKLLGCLKKHPSSARVVDSLLQLERELGIPVGKEWASWVRFPDALKKVLDEQLFIYAMMRRDYEAASEFIEKIDLDSAPPNMLNHAAEYFASQGNKAIACELYRRSFVKDPLQIPIPYRIQTLCESHNCELSLVGSTICVCIYTYNKAGLLDRTLKSLCDSDLGPAKIFLLLNGCTDDSLSVAEKYRGQVFKDRMTLITLPVNIGAPAARNWLLALPEVRACDYVAFLDDDVEVVPHWLRFLVKDLKENREAGVAGCKILVPGSPQRLQYLYRNLAIVRDDLIRISLDVPNWNYDVGFYDFRRETVNVMGCCHVLSRKAIEAVPNFDIRYSPSQMDDIAHDIEVCLAGLKVLYNGNVSCVHHQTSGIGRSSIGNMAKIGNIVGNDAKFYYYFIGKMEGLKKLSNIGNIPKYVYM